jgi:uncharacterized membrane protein
MHSPLPSAPLPSAPMAPHHDPVSQTLLLLMQQQQRTHVMGYWAGFLLYVGLSVVAFYLGVSWLQMSLGELTLAVRELRLLVLKPQ